jgi:hypothetical protein
LVKKIDVSIPLSQASGIDLDLENCSTGACPIK